jgi:hypothetical protein
MDYEWNVGKQACVVRTCGVASTGFVSNFVANWKDTGTARFTAYHCADHKDEAEQAIDHDYWRYAERVVLSAPPPEKSFANFSSCASQQLAESTMNSRAGLCPLVTSIWRLKL